MTILKKNIIGHIFFIIWWKTRRGIRFRASFYFNLFVCLPSDRFWLAYCLSCCSSHCLSHPKWPSDSSFSCHQSAYFFFIWGHSTFICPGFLHSKHMISLLPSLCFFLNLMSFGLEECWNFTLFFIICLNFLDMRVISSSVDPLQLLSEPSDSAICTFRALEKNLFSSHLEMISPILRVVESLLGRLSRFWRRTSRTLRIPNNSSYARVFRFLAF